MGTLLPSVRGPSVTVKAMGTKSPRFPHLRSCVSSGERQPLWVSGASVVMWRRHGVLCVQR